MPFSLTAFCANLLVFTVIGIWSGEGDEAKSRRWISFTIIAISLFFTVLLAYEHGQYTYFPIFKNGGIAEVIAVFSDPEDTSRTIYVLKNEDEKETRITSEVVSEDVTFSVGDTVIRSQKGVVILHLKPLEGKG
jgi:hypothetical protein